MAKKISVLWAGVVFLTGLACGNNSNKPLPVLAASLSSVADTVGKPFPRAVGYLNDYDRLFTASQKVSLESLLTASSKKAGAQFAVVTLDSSYTSEASFDTYTLRLANAWGVGEKGKNNGILIALCPDYRRLRIHNGSGIERRLSDAETKAVIDNLMLPEFKKGNFYSGLTKGVEAITAHLAKRP